MYSPNETNPHFISQPHYLHIPDQKALLPPTRASGPPLKPHPAPESRVPPSAYAASQPDIPPPQPPQPRPIIQPKTTDQGNREGEAIPGAQLSFGEQGSRPHQQQGKQQQRPSSLRATTSRKTKPIAWLIAAFCTLFWIVVIVAGLAVLIVYLVYKPQLPKFDISTTTLNVAYLDMGFLLNADLTLLANFTNPNNKVNVDFSYVIMDLYHDQVLIATRYVEPFTAGSGESMFQYVHMVTSQVRLSSAQSQDLTTQINNGRVKFDVRGLFRARSSLGGVLRYSYWLYAHCTITVTGPPTGALVAKRCTTKR